MAKPSQITAIPKICLNSSVSFKNKTLSKIAFIGTKKANAVDKIPKPKIAAHVVPLGLGKVQGESTRTTIGKSTRVEAVN